MKICTDATLFGAMAPVKGGERVLDIGTGTGLLALMAAQLGAFHVTGVELTEEAFAEARCNFEHSPWHERLEAVQGPIQRYCADSQMRYDLIISNPPFFTNHSKTSDKLRRQARHTDLLPMGDLVDCVDKLLGEEGLFYLLLPYHAVAGVVEAARMCGLHLIGQTDLRGYRHTRIKVSALTFSRQMRHCSCRILTIYQSHRVYAKASEQYLSPFLLRFA